MSVKIKSQDVVVEVSTFHPTYRDPGLAKKLYEVKCFQREHSFNQTELALLEHVTHQRVSALLKSLSKKALFILKRKESHIEAAKNSLG